MFETTVHIAGHPIWKGRPITRQNDWNFFQTLLASPPRCRYILWYSFQCLRMTEQLYRLLTEPNSTSFADFFEQALDSVGVTRNQFCRLTGLDNKTIVRIMSGEAQKVDVSILIRISEFFGIDHRILLEHLIAEMPEQAIRSLQMSRRAGFIHRNFDLKGLKKIAFIKNTSDIRAVEERIVRFFGLESLFQFEQIAGGANQLFSRTSRDPKAKMLRFWCAIGLAELRAIQNPNPFDPEQVGHVTSRLSMLTSNEKHGLLNACRALFQAGVTVIVNPYLPSSQVRGATFFVNGKPGIVLQDFRKKYDTIWFALAHELCHVVKDIDRIKSLSYHISYEASDDTDLFIDPIIENRADAFAAELLLPESKLRFIAPYIDIPGSVSGYAKKWQVSESIIYGRYAFKYGEPQYYQKVVSAEQAIRPILVDVYQSDNLRTAIEPLATIYGV